MSSAKRPQRDFRLRPMERRDWPEVARLIHASTNAWYLANGRAKIFACPPRDVQLFCSVYEALDPGCCLLAEDPARGRIAASCFYHPRRTHVSLGIMNVHPAYFGHGLAGRLLRSITDVAERRRLPVRLVSSAMNLDSFSLYTRQGFVPRLLFQDLIMQVPEQGLAQPPPGIGCVREARPADVPELVRLEQRIAGIDRGKDLRYFLENAAGIWHVSVYQGRSGRLEGFLASVAHPASRMLGPGVMRSEDQAAALIHAELDRHRGHAPVWLVPARCASLVRRMYAWGARNCELHVAQVRGAWQDPRGVVMPTFMPETG